MFSLLFGKKNSEALSNKISDQVVEKISQSIVAKIPTIKPNSIDIAEIAAKATKEASQTTEHGIKQAAQTTAKATKQAAWINGFSALIVAVVVAGTATGGTYLYFEPIKEDLKQTKDQLHNFQSCFYCSEKYRDFEAAMVKKAEELFVLKSTNQNVRDEYFAYKTSQEMHLVTKINSIPNKLAYDKLKDSPKP